MCQWHQSHAELSSIQHTFSKPCKIDSKPNRILDDSILLTSIDRKVCVDGFLLYSHTVKQILKSHFFVEILKI